MSLFVETLGIALVAMLSAPSTGEINSNFEVQGVILPHHNLVAEYIDEFYEDTRENVSDDLQQVILMSTNHYDVGRGGVLFDPNLCTDMNCALDLAEDLSSSGIVAFEPGTMSNEHGIKVHLDRISRSFEGVEILPLILRWQASQEDLDMLVDSVLAEVDMEETLVIASIDFSHFVTEETALANDTRTQAWLEDFGVGVIDEFSLEDIWDLENSLSMDTEVSTALDSPETFYVFAKLMGKTLGNGRNLELHRRTSSLSLTDRTEGDPMQNTSHLFVKVGR